MTLDLISEMTPPTCYPQRYATVSVAQIIFSIQVTCFVVQTTPSNPTIHISQECHLPISWVLKLFDFWLWCRWLPVLQVIYHSRSYTIWRSTKYFSGAFGEYFYWQRYRSIHLTTKELTYHSFFFHEGYPFIKTFPSYLPPHLIFSTLIPLTTAQ